MPPRLASPAILSFTSFYSCSHTCPGNAVRTLSSCSSPSVFTRPPLRACAKFPAQLNREVKKRSFHASAVHAAPKDPYKVLGVQKDASSADIKKVYFSLARKYHPDTNPDKGAREKFVEIQEAYDILKDEKKRASYDQYGAASQQPGFDPDAFANARNFGGGFGGFPFGTSFGAGRDPRQSELLEQLFGFAGRTSGFAADANGGDLSASVGVSFMEAAKGTSRTINIQPLANCSTCHGTGLKSGAKRSACASCGGTGTRTYVIDNGFQMASTCPSCQGAGTTVPPGSHCGSCSGYGQVRTKKSIKVDIPAGVEDGMSIRVPNAGDAPASGRGKPGDLLVRVNVASSKVFRRQGPNLHHEARVPLHVALLGGRVRVPTLDGDVDVRIPVGTQQGEEMILKGRGIASVFGRDKGDLFVTFAVQLPRTLTPRQREILQQYADDVEGRRPAASDAPQSSTRSETASSTEAKETPLASVDDENGSKGSLDFDPPMHSIYHIDPVPSHHRSLFNNTSGDNAQDQAAPAQDGEQRRKRAAI